MSEKSYEEAWNDSIKLEALDDGLENVLTGLGTDIDKSTANHWTHSGRNLDHVQLAARYREDWISQKVCNIVPQDMTREWRDCDNEIAKQADDELGVKFLFEDAYRWARLYGTSFLVLDIKGAGALDKPLNVEKLKPGCINSIQVVDRTRMYPMGEIDYNPMSPYYGMPQFYQMVGSTQPIHTSRFIRFDATRLPLFETWRNQWFADSTLIPLEDVIDQFHSAASSASALCQEALVDVVAIPGLQAILSNPLGEQAILKRMRIMKQVKSLHKVLLMDSNEEYTTKAMNLNSLRELIWEYLKIVAAACGIPATRFLSASPDGLNATGQSDLNNYVQMLQSLQHSVFSPLLKQLDPIICKHYGIEEFKYKWNDLFPESALERAERSLILLQGAREAIEGQTLTIEESRQFLFDSGIFKYIDPSKVPPVPEVNKKPEPAPMGGIGDKPKGEVKPKDKKKE